MARLELDRRSDRSATALAAAAGKRRGDAVRQRLAVTLEHQLARAVERRLGRGRAGGRVPGALEARIVAALERRFAAGRPLEEPPGGAFARLARRRSALPATRGTTLGALVISIFARGIVRALVRLVRLLGRGLVTTPGRRLLRLLARRTVRAPPTHQLGLLALLLAALAYLRRVIAGRAQVNWGAVLAVLRLLRRLLSVLRGPAGGALRALWTRLWRELRRVAGRRDAHSVE